MIFMAYLSNKAQNCSIKYARREWRTRAKKMIVINICIIPYPSGFHYNWKE